MACLELTHAQHAETDDLTRRIHALHHGVVGGGLFIASRVGKADFQEIRLRVEPDFYFISHKSTSKQDGFEDNPASKDNLWIPVFFQQNRLFPIC